MTVLSATTMTISTQSPSTLEICKGKATVLHRTTSHYILTKTKVYLEIARSYFCTDKASTARTDMDLHFPCQSGHHLKNDWCFLLHSDHHAELKQYTVTFVTFF